MKHNEYKQLLQLSLFGELKSEEQLKLKKHLLTCEECRIELEDQKNLLELISGKQKTNVDEKVLIAARYQLRGALRSERSSNNILNSITENIFQYFTTPLKFAFAGAALLIVGFVIGGIFFSKSSQSEFTSQQAGENRFASLSEDISISNVRFIDSDASDGEVEFTFEASRPVRLKGNINDQQIQSVLTYAMLNEQNPGSRLNSINAMNSEKPVQYDNDVKNALITVVMTDENPGVRREALKLMSKLPYDESVKQTFLYVITNDTVSGLRIEALNALIVTASQGHKLNQEELNLFRNKLQDDENPYIKLRSKTILQEYN
ncbi:MAG: zf-HC2 domain-containing protein [Ignavibacteriaceae bacterium]|nr:zf-HC2 domain-containing protein [Ignavibacteriaceae bacterium]